MSWLLRLTVEPTEIDLASSLLWDFGTTGVADIGQGNLIAGFNTEVEANRASEQLQNQGLGGSSVSAYDPSVIPTPMPSTVEANGTTVVLADTGAFGHGKHPTTAMAISEVTRRVKAGQTVLDFGCGTGVLAILAAMAGAKVVAIDIAPAAIEATQTNAVANEVQLTVDELSNLDSQFDLIMANMLLADLRDVAADIVRLRASGGLVVATGFLEEQVNEVLELFAPLQVMATAGQDDWRCLTLGES